jgi:hypothetical protein
VSLSGVPWPTDERLRRLVELVEADDDFGDTSKPELVSALIQAAEPDAVWLWDRILRFKRATVGQAAFWVPDDEDPITFDPRPPGRRAKT